MLKVKTPLTYTVIIKAPTVFSMLVLVILGFDLALTGEKNIQRNLAWYEMTPTAMYSS